MQVFRGMSLRQGLNPVPATREDFLLGVRPDRTPSKNLPESQDQMKALLRPRAALPRYLVRVPIAAAATDLISDSSMFPEIDCEELR